MTRLVSWISYRSPFIICQVLVGTGKIYQRERAVAANGTHAQRERIDTGARTVIAMDNKKRVVGEVHAGGYGAPNAGKIATTVRISIGIQNEGYAKSAAAGFLGCTGGIKLSGISETKRCKIAALACKYTCRLMAVNNSHAPAKVIGQRAL